MDQALVTQSIKDFEDVLRRYGFIKREFSQHQIDMIRHKIEEHCSCLEEWLDNDETEGEDMIEISVYAGGENVALECANCNTVIIDSEYFK